MTGSADIPTNRSARAKLGRRSQRFIHVRSKVNPASIGWFGSGCDEFVYARHMAPGFAHGFCALSEFAELHYKVSRLYDQADEGGLIWNDSDVGIRWPIDAPIVSERDRSYPRISELDAKQLPHL
jgi:dTDP-4-dehydrorhamnose 3,5-epimerase